MLEIDNLVVRDYWRSDRPDELLSVVYVIHTRMNASADFLTFLDHYPHAVTGYANELKGDAQYRVGKGEAALASYEQASRLGGGSAALIDKINAARTSLEVKK